MLILFAVLLLSQMMYATEFNGPLAPRLAMSEDEDDIQPPPMQPIRRTMVEQIDIRPLFTEDDNSHALDPQAFFILSTCCFCVGAGIGHYFFPSERPFAKNVPTGAQAGGVCGAAAVVAVMQVPAIVQEINAITEYLLKEKAE